MSIRQSGFAIVAGACWALASCAAPKPTVVEPPTKPVRKTATTTDSSEPGPPKSPMRIGDMLGALPKDSELRATNPGAAADKPSGSAVIVSPPPQPSEKKPETTP